MSKRRVIADSDDDSDVEIATLSVTKRSEDAILSPISNSSNDDCIVIEETKVVDGNSWFEKRDTATITADEKRHNIEVAKKQSQLLKRRRLQGGAASPSAPPPVSPLIKSRHTTRKYESPEHDVISGDVADYDLRLALLDDTPDEIKKRGETGMARLAKSKMVKQNDRSNRLLQRESGRQEPLILVDMSEERGGHSKDDDAKKKKKKNKRKDDSDDDDDADGYQFYGGGGDSDGDDERGDAEEERKRAMLELKSREVIDRCSDLSVVLRKALRSWQDGEEEDGDPNCVNLCRISCGAEDRAGVGAAGGGGETGTHLLQQRDLAVVCPSMVLKDYQLVGVNWLKLLHQNDVNGVLADDMGLGKTVQTIAFLAWLFSCREDPERLREQVKRAHEGEDEEGEGEEVKTDEVDDEREVEADGEGHVANAQILPHLIVVPASTLANWCKEFEKFCPTLKVMRFHGSAADRDEMKYQLRRAFLPKYQPVGGVPEDERIDVVITTYTMFERDSGADDRSFLKKLPFEYLVLDEAHCIKNSQSSRYQNLRGLSSRRRLLLSGTPVQNDVRELLALLSFLMPKVFRMEYIDFLYDSFMERFIDGSGSGSGSGSGTGSGSGSGKGGGKGVMVSKQTKENKIEETGTKEGGGEAVVGEEDKAALLDGHKSSIQELRCMLAPFVLRRLKCDVLRQMPPKIDIPIKLKMTDRQASLYEDIICTHLLNKTSTTTATTQDLSILPPKLRISTSEASNIFTDLRKASNHPLLLRTHFSSSEVMNHMAAVCCTVEHFGDQCDQSRVLQELSKLSDFDLNYLCLEYPSFLGKYQLPSSVLYDSPKLLQLKTLLPKLIGEDHRILIFSQWTKMLDILGALLGDLQYKFLRLDGSTPVRERQKLIEDFETNLDIPIFILSTRAGGLGINLTAADTVILHDLDFNPENDRQAEDRCHRIGQLKEVSIYRLIAEDSVDENIFDLGEKKKRLSKAVLESGGGAAVAGGKDTSEINRMLQQAVLKSMNKKQIIDLAD